MGGSVRLAPAALCAVLSPRGGGALRGGGPGGRRLVRAGVGCLAPAAVWAGRSPRGGGGCPGGGGGVPGSLSPDSTVDIELGSGKVTGAPCITILNVIRGCR